MNHKLRDDMMYFYGQLQAMQWAGINKLRVSADMLENMCAQYESILKRLYEDFNDD
jgi:hypothetical protein